MARVTPRILVTGADEYGAIPWWMTRRALRRAGAEAVRVTPGRGLPEGEYDGLVLGGGADVHPRHYGASVRPADPPPPPREHTWLRQLAWLPIRLARWAAGKLLRMGTTGLDEARDALELPLAQQALASGLPTLGICRGMQLVNVVLGGSLIVDLRAAGHLEAARRTLRAREPVSIVPGTRLARAIGDTKCRVNSLHTQALGRLGRGLVVTARNGWNTIEAVEHPEHPFMVGVQWHPEYLPGRTSQRRLFAALVEAARAYRAQRQALGVGQPMEPAGVMRSGGGPLVGTR